MNLIKKAWLKMRMARRVGAFVRAREMGMSTAEARTYSDSLYPPTDPEREYEEALRMTQEAAEHETKMTSAVEVIMRGCWDLPRDLRKGEITTYARTLWRYIQQGDSREAIEFYLSRAELKLQGTLSGAYKEIADRSIGLLRLSG